LIGRRRRNTRRPTSNALAELQPGSEEGA